MKKKESVKFFWLTLVIVAVLSMIGCMTIIEQPVAKISNEKKIAIVPFINYSDEQVSKKFDPKTGKLIDSVLVEDYLTDFFVTQLKQKKFYNIIVLPKITKHKAHKLSHSLVSKDVPEDTDIIILSRIYRFIDRKGGNYSVRAPASIAFDIKVVNFSNGRIINHYEYDETQRSLSENIFNVEKFIRRKGHWVKAIELARYGVNEGIKKITF